MSASVRMDGFRSKWSAAVEAPRNWRKVVLIAIAVILGVAAFAVGMSRTSVFAVEKIDVSGLAHLNRDEVLSVAKLHNGMPLTSVDEATIRRRLGALPWVAEAKVSTSWPHGVRVAIVEEKPAFVAQTPDGKWAQVSSRGMVLAVGPTPEPHLPVALGVQAPATVGGAIDGVGDLLQVTSAMPDSLRGRVTQLQQGQDGIRLGLDAGTIVVLGDTRQLADKLTAAAAVLSHTDPKTIGTLDVRSPELPIATPPGGSSAVTDKPAATTATTAAPSGAKGSTTTTTVRRTTTTVKAKSILTTR